MASQRPQAIIIGKAQGMGGMLAGSLLPKVPLVRKNRLRNTVEKVVLPFLKTLDALYSGRRPGTVPPLTKRTLKDIEDDIDVFIYAMHLFDLGLATGLINFRQGSKGKKAKPTKSKTVPVGSCGMSVKEARQFFLRAAALKILKDAGHDAKKLDEILGSYEIKSPSDLYKLSFLVGFDPLSITELKKGLGRGFGKLMEKDEAYFKILQSAKPVHFLRPLRYALGDNFSRILDWDSEFITAVAEGLDHSAKITALGPQLLQISDPHVIRALGTWEVKEAKGDPGKKGKSKKKYVTRIDEVKKSLGPGFDFLLESSPKVILEIGSWTVDEIKQVKNHLQYLDGKTILTLVPLPFPYKVAVLEGLWDKLGRDFMETGITSDGGVKLLATLTKEISGMGIEKNPPDKIQDLVKSEFFDDFMVEFLEKKKKK